MDQNDIRAAISQAKINEDSSAFLFFEILIISIILGLAFQSWWVFGGVLLGTLMALKCKGFAFILCFALSLGWGAVGYGIGMLFSSLGASVVFAILAFLIAAGTHRAAIEWHKDMSS